MATLLVRLAIVLAATISVVAALAWSVQWWDLAALPVSVGALTVHDVAQKKHAILRNYPVVGHLGFRCPSRAGQRTVGVRHEEVAAFAAGAQAQLTGSLGVCMGTVGPGSIRLLNGLYDAKKSHAPVLAICGQVPMEELGSDYFQEVNNNLLFRDVAIFARTVTAAARAP